MCIIYCIPSSYSIEEIGSNIKVEGPVAVTRWCAVKVCVGNWNENRAHVSEIAAYRRAISIIAEERRYFGYMCGQSERARHGVLLSDWLAVGRHQPAQ